MVPSVFVYPHTESDVFEWEAIDDLCECLFGDLRREQVRHGSHKYGLMIRIENLAHATCVDVLGGRNSRPPRVVVHVVFDSEGLFVVVLRLAHRGDGSYVERKEGVKYVELGQETVTTRLQLALTPTARYSIKQSVTVPRPKKEEKTSRPHHLQPVI